MTIKNRRRNVEIKESVNDYLNTLSNNLKIDKNKLIDIFIKINQKEISDYFDKNHKVEFCNEDGISVYREEEDINKLVEINEYGEEIKSYIYEKINVKNIPLSLLKKIRARFKNEISLIKIKNNETIAIENIGEIISGKVIKIYDSNYENYNNKVLVLIFDFCVYVNYDQFMPQDIIEPGREYLFIIIDVIKNNNKFKTIISRNNDDFVFKIIERNIPEIKNKSIEIDQIYRFNGIKSIVFVKSKLIKKCTNHCIGVKGVRSKQISLELCGEKIIFVDSIKSINEVLFTVFDLKDYENIYVKETDQTIFVFNDVPQISIRIIKSIQTRKAVEEYYGKSIIAVDTSKKDNFEFAISHLIDIYNKNFVKSIIKIISCLNDISNLKPSNISVNMLLEINEIENIFYKLLIYFNKNNEYSKEDVKLLINYDLSISEYQKYKKEKNKQKNI